MPTNCAIATAGGTSIHVVACHLRVIPSTCAHADKMAPHAPTRVNPPTCAHANKMAPHAPTRKPNAHAHPSTCHIFTHTALFMPACCLRPIYAGGGPYTSVHARVHVPILRMPSLELDIVDINVIY
ncbi:hypothetical protein BD779DRAFT_1496250, partial [Infundibulicybe gibba]